MPKPDEKISMGYKLLIGIGLFLASMLFFGYLLTQGLLFFSIGTLTP